MLQSSVWWGGKIKIGDDEASHTMEPVKSVVGRDAD